jgi:hypothetical protein
VAFEKIEYVGTAPLARTSGSTSSSATSITGDDLTGWPTGGANGRFWVVLGRATSVEEKVLVASRSGNTLTLDDVSDRGEDGTSAATHAEGTTLEHVATASDLAEANAAVRRVLVKGVEIPLVFTFTQISTLALLADKGTQWYAPRSGKIVGLTMQVNDTRVSGSITGEVHINAGATGVTAAIDGSNTTNDHTLQAPADPFVAGDLISVVLTPSSFSPSTNGNAIVWVVFDDAFT